nr:dynamin-2A-like [Ipomoea batatas]
MEAIEELQELANLMRQAGAVLANEDVEAVMSASSRRPSTFLNVVALGCTGAGKSAVLNSVIGHPALPTGEGGATRAPICVELKRDSSLSSKLIILQIDSKSQEVSASALRRSLQERLSKISSKSRDEIYLKLKTSTAPPLKLIDLPGVDKGRLDSSSSQYVEHSDAVLLVVIPASQAPEVSSYKALRIAKENDGESTRTIGVISKIDQAASEPKILAAVQALLLNQGPPSTSDIPWVALIGQSVSIASAQSGNVGDDSLETAWRAESESLKSILTGAPQSKLGRLALVETLAQQIRNRMKLRLPNLLSGLQDMSQSVKDELAKLGGQVQSAEGTRALALELCREFEDTFLQHLTSGEGIGWKVVASFEGNFPNRIKQLPLDRHFDIKNVKRIVLEADGYQPYLISPEKGLRSLIKTVLEMAKEPSQLCVDEVHRVLSDIVLAAANGTPGLGRYPPFKREVVALATAALEKFKNEAKHMVVALVDMERAFVPPQHFIRLVQRRYRRDEDQRSRSSKRAYEAEQSIINRASSPQPGGSLKSMKDKPTQQDKDVPEGPVLKTAGPEGEITAGFLLKKSGKANSWNKRWFVLNEKSGKECNLEDLSEEEEAALFKSSKDKREAANLTFKITSRIQYKTVLKAHSNVILKADTVAEKVEWVNKLKTVISSKGGQVKAEIGVPIRQSFSDGSIDTMARKPADQEEELRLMAQEVRGYVEAVMNSLAANVPKAVVLCQVEKAREDMLNKLYISISGQSLARIEELLMEDQNVKRKRERCKKQSSLVSELTRKLNTLDSRASTASDYDGAEGRAGDHSSTDDWSSAFDPGQSGDSTSRGRRAPSRLPPAPPDSASTSRY